MLAPKKQASLQGRPSWAEFPCNLIFIVDLDSQTSVNPVVVMTRTIDTATTTTTTTADYGTIMHYLDTTWYSKDAASNDGDVNQSYRTKRRAWHWGQLFGRARSREGSKGTDSRELAAISCRSANNRVSIWRLTEYNPIMSTFKGRHSVIFYHILSRHVSYTVSCIANVVLTRRRKSFALCLRASSEFMVRIPAEACAAVACRSGCLFFRVR
jgi:hypothetical protein